MTLGLAQRQGDLLDDITRFCDRVLAGDSIYSFLHREGHRLFPDEFFEDLFASSGRRSVPPSVIATVMVLQRLEGLSDREAVERYTFDSRWRYAAGVGGYDGEGRLSFVHTVLVEMRARLRASARPDRVFEVTRETAGAAGLVGRRRVLDSTPLYDAVATMDTITLIRSALRGLLHWAGDLEADLRALLTSGDEYADSSKPRIDWDDAEGREAMIDSRARDAFACLVFLEGRQLAPELAQAAELLAAVTGQDLEKGDDGVFRIARRVAPNRIISTVDTETRHGHKTSARGFDGYKGHIAIDPDSEIITETAVTAGNVGDAAAADDLLAECLGTPSADGMDNVAKATAAAELLTEDVAIPNTGETEIAVEEPIEVFGDCAYGTGPMLDKLEVAGATPMVKVQSPVSVGGRFSKDRFVIDLDAGTVSCPNNSTVAIGYAKDGSGKAEFGSACMGCPLRAQCTKSAAGRTISVNRHEAHLTAARTRQKDPSWTERYRAIRPKVERKIGHLMFRRHGGRRARVRGQTRVAQDFSWRATAINLARLAALRVASTTAGGWTARPAR